MRLLGISKNLKMHSLEKIPVEYFKENILNSIEKFQITIIQAETGSGKTIYVPKIIYSAKLFKKIIISQTKRVATISAANFLGSLLNKNNNNCTGYSVRFEDKTNKSTKIKFVTDGILFQLLADTFFFDKYTCIILDEFHERTVNTDLLACILKHVLIFRKDLKLIFMSASGDSHKIAEFFQKSVGKIDIPGSLFKIKTFYTKQTQLDFIISICSAIVKFHFIEKLENNFLVFFPGYKEILECEKMLRFILDKKKDNFTIFKLHSTLPNIDQMRIVDFLDDGKRKIILSTNISESSLTIKGIKFVFDSGFSRQKILNWKTGLNVYKTSPISKSEAKQRAGRAGRNSDGKCFRLFTYLEYSKFTNFPEPEIKRTELSLLFLQILTSNFSALFSLDFIDVPPSWIVKRSLENLFVLGAITKKVKLTRIGKLLSIYPIELKLSRCIIESLKIENRKTEYYVLLSCSLLSLNCDFFKIESIRTWKNFSILENIPKKSEECYILALILKEYLDIKEKTKKQTWCNFKKIDYYLLELAENIMKQLYGISEFSRNYIGINFKKKKLFQGVLEEFKYCLTAGFFQNLGRFIRNSNNFQLITSGILIDLNQLDEKRITLASFMLFYELLVSDRFSIKGLLTTKLFWLLYFGEKIFY